jgi:hypothetical protein
MSSARMDLRPPVRAVEGQTKTSVLAEEVLTTLSESPDPGSVDSYHGSPAYELMCHVKRETAHREEARNRASNLFRPCTPIVDEV